LASPLAANIATIPEEWLFAADLPGHRVMPNLLPNGDCDDLDKMTQAGWRMYQHPTEGVKSEVLLSPKSVHAGLGSVQLKARPSIKTAGPPPVFETAPVWLTTPPVNVDGGALLWIHGWYRLPAAPVGNADGFLVLESIGGEPLAERLAPTPGWKDAVRARQGQKPLTAEQKSPADDWKEFSLYRVAPRAGALVVTFALCGLGDVWLDDVAVQVVERHGALPTPPATANAPEWLRPRR
jgi:hypothetical protein